METKNHIEEAEEYLRKNLKKGYKIYDLKLLLKKQGYSEVAINKAISEIEKEIEKERLAKEQLGKKQQEKEIIEQISEDESGKKQFKFSSFLKKIKSFFKFSRNKNLNTPFN